MVIDAKMFNEKERTIIPYTTNIIKEAYGIDISHLPIILIVDNNQTDA